MQRLIDAWFELGRSERARRYRAHTRDGWQVALYRYEPQPGMHRTPVILCHGMSSNRWDMDGSGRLSLARYLARRGYDAWVLELRGAGRSTRPTVWNGKRYQLVPYGRPRANPPVVADPSWDSPSTKALFARACADCHSHETRWPWYAYVAPVSWLVAREVEEGREHFNVSEWGRGPRNEGEEAAEMLAEREMPLRAYLLAHPEARLSEGERTDLIRGLEATSGRKAPRR